MRRAIAFLLATLLAWSQAGDGVARGIIRDSEIERTLDMLAAPIFEAAELDQRDVSIFIIGDRSLNAFVTASRGMFFHTGLLRELDTPEQLIGVIAHETGHLVRGHVVSRISALENAATTSLLATLIGVAVGIAAGAPSGGAGIAGGGQRIAARDFLRFNRGQESSADQAALTFMNRAAIDPIGMIQTLRRLEQEQQVFLGATVDPYVLTHPLSRARIQALEQGVAQSPARGRQLDPELVYWHGRMRAKLDGFLSDPTARGAVESYGVPEFDLYREAIQLHRLPDPDAAIAKVEALIEMRPDDPYYWELKGQILFESGRGAASVEPYRRAAELAPNAPLIAGGLGAALLTLDTPEADAEALVVLERAAIADPYDARLRHALARAYDRADKPALAAVTNAERAMLLGRTENAKIMAKRAQTLAPYGSPAWLRADDILAIGDRD